MMARILPVPVVCLGLLAGCDAGKELGEVARALQAEQAQQENQARQQAESMAQQMEQQMRAQMAGDQPVAAPPLAPAGAAPAIAGAGPTGVPECDEYLAKYPACLQQKVPAMARGPMLEGFRQTEAAWKQAASTPEGRAGLAPMCKMAMDQARMAMRMYGCAL